MANVGSQEIKCSVQSCKYNDKTRYCTLNDIVVGSSTTEASSKQHTDCMSFECE